MTVDDVRARFRDLHVPGSPLVMPNAWDAGSARLFASLGFAAIATTSSGFAATLGRSDGAVSREEAIAHTAALAAASPLPVNADLEDCFADDAAGVAETITAAAGAGTAGASVEDYDRTAIHPLGAAVERVAAAVEAARPHGVVITARAENLIRGVHDLGDTISRLQAFQEAGADVLYAPGLATVTDVRSVVTSVDRPVNVILLPGGPGVGELAAAGVARISVGGALAWVAWGAVADAAQQLLADNAPAYADLAATGARARNAALT